jgi:4-hydroxybenzoate polyprenyltransferase
MSTTDTASAASTASQSGGAVPLYVDLDGTLISTDVLWESFVAVMRKKPLAMLLVPIWLILGGRPRLKRELAARAHLDVTELPYRPTILEYLRAQKAQGRPLILATAADRSLGEAVAAHLNLFDAVMGSEGSTNLKSHHKLKAIQQRSPEGFGYAGDSRADLPIWAAAKESLLVAPSKSVLAQVENKPGVTVLLARTPGRLKALVKLLRPHQWVKNLLVFLPIICAHKLNAAHAHQILDAVIAFAALSLCASSVYILNDLLDVNDDRRHPTKCRRPLASGALKLPVGLWLFPMFLLAGCLLAVLFLPRWSAALLLVYWCCSAAYSIHFKRRLLLDVFILAGLYTLRILIGGAATDIGVSPWLLAFSVFFFVSLAFAKRYAELRKMRDLEHSKIRGRGYTVEDLAIMESVGPASGYMAVLVLALYLNSEIAKDLYPHPLALLLICPLLMYWLTRVWFFARRGWLNMDPVLFATRDRVSWYTFALAAALWVVASCKGIG